MNGIWFIGNLTKDPEQRVLVSGRSLVEFNVAVNRNYSKNEERKTDYFRCTVFGEFGKTCMKALYKGASVFVQGEFQPYLFTRVDGGQGVNLNVNVEKLKFLSPRKDHEAADPEVPDTTGAFTDVSTENIPF